MLTRIARPWQGVLSLPGSAQRALLHSLLFGFALSVSELLFNFYLASLGYAADVAGIFSTTLRMAGVLLGLPGGALVDRIGPQRALIGSMLLYAGSWALILSSGALPLLLLGYLLVGAAYTVAMASIVALLAATVGGADRARLFGLNAMALVVIGVLGNAVGGALPTLAAALTASDPQSVLAYRLAMLSIVAVSLLAALPLLRLRLPPTEATTPVLPSQRGAGSTARRLGWLVMLRMSMASFFLGAAGGWILPFQNLYLRQEFGLSDGAIGAILGWIALPAGIGALVGTAVAARLGVQRAAVLLRSVSVPAMLLMAFTPLLPLAVLGLGLRAVAVVASYPLYDALIMEATPPRQRGTSAGMINLTWALGWAICAAISGVIQVRWGFTPVLVASALCYIASTWSMAALRIGPRP
jgi:MFS family permease